MKASFRAPSLIATKKTPVSFKRAIFSGYADFKAMKTLISEYVEKGCIINSPT